jgi:hypothetical protein
VNVIRTSDSLEEFAVAWVAAAAAMPAVPKRTKGQVGNQTRFYADMATVVETVQPVLAAHGLAYLQGVSDGDRVVTVTTRLLHKSGEWIEDSLSMPTGQNTPQAVGSACTYARRYSLMALLGLAPDDDDGATASKAPAVRNRPDPPVNTATGELLATDKQIQRIQILLKDYAADLPTPAERRDARLAWLSDFVGRPLTTSKELTKAEAARVIDHLERVGVAA